MESIFENEKLLSGRIISFSKSVYREEFPDNEIYFNANIFVLGEGKIWYGDIDVTKEKEQLENVAREIGKDLYILREMDGRFGNEELKDSEIITRAMCKITK
jgi:hypothetical protein